MKSYFAINHNPDAKDLKQLAQKTGLTKRVLQVRHFHHWLCVHLPSLARK
jgi:hypothetical protein